MHKKLIAVLVGLTLLLGGGMAGAGEKQTTKVHAKTKRYYEVMWAADPVFCEKVRSYADQQRADYVPSNIVFGNVQWIELDDYDRRASNVNFSDEKNSKTVFKWITRRRTGFEWDYALDIFHVLISFDDLSKNPVSFTGKQEWTFNPDYVELTGLNGQKSPKPSKWCAKLKNINRQDLGCKNKHPIWRFSFFDLLSIDGKTYITAATEKYQSPDDTNLPIVILVGRYIAPPKQTPLRFGSDGTMGQIEHRCYLIKTK